MASALRNTLRAQERRPDGIRALFCIGFPGENVHIWHMCDRVADVPGKPSGKDCGEGRVVHDRLPSGISRHGQTLPLYPYGEHRCWGGTAQWLKASDHGSVAPQHPPSAQPSTSPLIPHPPEPAAVTASGAAMTRPMRRWVPRRVPVQGPYRALQGYRASSASPALCGNCRSLVKACFSSCRTRSRLRPRTSPMSWRLCGSYASRP